MGPREAGRLTRRRAQSRFDAIRSWDRNEGINLGTSSNRRAYHCVSEDLERLLTMPWRFRRRGGGWSPALAGWSQARGAKLVSEWVSESASARVRKCASTVAARLRSVASRAVAAADARQRIRGPLAPDGHQLRSAGAHRAPLMPPRLLFPDTRGFVEARREALAERAARFMRL